jgi:hypothetical protein
VREEQYFLENNTYACMPNLGACDDSVFFPDSAPTADARPYNPAGTSWIDLKVNVDKPALYCVYSVTAGPAGGGYGNRPDCRSPRRQQRLQPHDRPDRRRLVLPARRVQLRR